MGNYGPGDYYHRHLDSHGPEENPRAITLLLYLNDGWDPMDGGLLKGYYDMQDSEACFTLEPRLGTMCAFLARDIWHEVTLIKPCTGGANERLHRKSIQFWIHYAE